MLPPNFNQSFPNLDVLRNMQPRLRPIAPYQAPGGGSPQAPLSPGMPGVWGGQPPGINPVGPAPVRPYPVQPVGYPGAPVQGGPMQSPGGMEGNQQNPQLANLMALRSMMMRPQQGMY